MANATGSAHDMGPTGAPQVAADTRPLLLRIAVAACALAGAMALALVTGPVRPELFIAAAVAVGVGAVVYLAQPRAGAIAFLVLGTTICVACMAGLFVLGAVPWLLTGFWGGAATLLAGLLDLIGRDGTDSMIVATVAAVVSLLLLSALGLGEYVRVNWTPTERAMLEEVPAAVAGTGASGAGSIRAYFEPAPQGRWACRWMLRTRDAAKSWQAMRLAVESAGWAVTVDSPGESLVADKHGFVLTITAGPPGEDAAAGLQRAVPASSQPAQIEVVASLGAQ